MKKVVSLILTLVFVVGMCSTAAFAAGGDVNNDNTVNATDFLTLEQHILGVNVIDDTSADVLGDGVVDSADLVILQATILMPDEEEPETPEIGGGIEDGGFDELYSLKTLIITEAPCVKQGAFNFYCALI